MPRKRRHYIAGIPAHVIHRGNNRLPCFFAQEDYRSYLEWLEDAAARYGCEIHAYVLMTNHVHLLMTPMTDSAISKVIQSVGRRFVRYAQWEANRILRVHQEYLALGSTREEQYAAYRELFRQELDAGSVDEIRNAAGLGIRVGNQGFKDEIERVLGRRVRPGGPGRPKKTETEST